MDCQPLASQLCGPLTSSRRKISHPIKARVPGHTLPNRNSVSKSSDDGGLLIYTTGRRAPVTPAASPCHGLSRPRGQEHKLSLSGNGRQADDRGRVWEVRSSQGSEGTPAPA